MKRKIVLWLHRISLFFKKLKDISVKMMNSRANVRPYNPQCLIGNWYEDRVMEEVGLGRIHIRAHVIAV